MGPCRRIYEAIKRASRMVLFVIFVVGSLLLSSSPLLLTLADIVTPCILLSTFGCCHTCFKFNHGFRAYNFRSSILDIPFLSLARSFVIFCAYSICGLPSFTYAPYLATATFCGFASTIFLIVKTTLFTVFPDAERPPVLILKHSWIMPLFVLYSTAIGVGHIVVAYKTMCQSRRKSYIYGLDPEIVQLNKAFLNGCPKFHPLTSKGANVNKANGSATPNAAEERNVPACMLADKDSLFMVWEGIRVHYKKSECDSRLWQEILEEGKQLQYVAKVVNPSPSDLEDRVLSSSIPESNYPCSLQSKEVGVDEPVPSSSPPCLGKARVTSKERPSSRAIILIHGFGGGVFSWRHVMLPLAAQTGWIVATFDRPGWGLTSRPNKADWERRGANNPYELHSQVDLLYSFCRKLNLLAAVLVGHDDGGLLALMAAARFHAEKDAQVAIKGLVLVGVSLSREVVSPFTRMLLHKSGSHHMLRRLLRSEIGEVTNRQAWYNASKLTPDVMELYKAPLRITGWDTALGEISRASMHGVLSSSSAAEFFKLVHDLPALVVAGIHDIVVPFSNAQALAAKLPSSRLVAISNCGHLPHEENPGELLVELVLFVSNL